MISGKGGCRSQYKQWLAALAAILPIVMVGFLDMIVNVDHRIPSQPDRITEHLTVTTVLTTIIGCLVGAIFGALSSDIFGRKRTLLATAICIVGGIVGVFLTSSKYCFIIPFIGGINAGIACTVVPVYISEIADDNIRGRLLMLQLVGIYIGQLIITTIGAMKGPIVMYVGLIAIPILFLIAIFWFPESPYYLTSKKQYESAAKSLAFFRGIDQLAAGEEVQNISNSTEENSNHQGICQRISQLFRGANGKGLIIVVFLIIVQWNRMFIHESVDVAFALNNLTPTKFIDAVRIVTGARLIWSLILVFTIDLVGRRRYLLGATLVGFVVASFATLVDYASTLPIFSGVVILRPFETLRVTAFILDLCQMVIFGVPLIFIAELFPTNVRSIASSMAVIFGTILKGIFFMIDCRSWGSGYEPWVFIPIYLLAFSFILAYVPETKKNTFSEIQIELADTRLKCRRNTTSQYDELIETK